MNHSPEFRVIMWGFNEEKSMMKASGYWKCYFLAWMVDPWVFILLFFFPTEYIFSVFFCLHGIFHNFKKMYHSAT